MRIAISLAVVSIGLLSFGVFRSPYAGSTGADGETARDTTSEAAVVASSPPAPDSNPTWASGLAPAMSRARANGRLVLLFVAPSADT